MPRRLGRRAVAALVVLVLAAAALGWFGDSSSTTIRAHFTSAEGLNVDDEVKVLGVRVGKVTAIDHDDDAVVVSMEVDSDQPIPANARAAIVSPSLVSGRFVQLAPVWNGGERLEDDATIDVARTAVPVTFDDIKQQLTDLATTLGPRKGAEGGPLASTIVALERGLGNGNARHLRTALAELRKAASALSDGRTDLFSTIENLDAFTRNLAVHDAAVRGFTDELDGVATTLATHRRTLRGALRDLADVLAATEDYLGRHRGRLTGSLKDLNLLMAALADRSDELAGVLHISPHALIDLHNTVERQAVTGRSTLSNYDDASQLLCGALLGTGATSEQCRTSLTPLLDLLGLSSPLPGGSR